MTPKFVLIFFIAYYYVSIKSFMLYTCYFYCNVKKKINLKMQSSFQYGFFSNLIITPAYITTAITT